MMLLSKLMHLIYSHLTSLTVALQDFDVMVDGLDQLVWIAWEQKMSKKPPPQAAKISAVKPAPQESSFQGQQDKGEGPPRKRPPRQEEEAGCQVCQSRARHWVWLSPGRICSTSMSHLHSPSPPFRQNCSPTCPLLPCAALLLLPLFQQRPQCFKQDWSPSHNWDPKKVGTGRAHQGSTPLKRAHTPDDNVVSLDSSGDELDEELVALVSGPSKSRYAALRIILSKTLTKACSVLKQIHSLALDLNNKSDLFAALLSDTKMNTPAEWLLDSGVSMHFTNDINDFIDYQTITPIKVVTANRLMQVNVMDMVIFRTILFELLVFFTFTLLTFYFAC